MGLISKKYTFQSAMFKHIFMNCQIDIFLVNVGMDGMIYFDAFLYLVERDMCPSIANEETAFGICANTCDVDNECDGIAVCCPNACGGRACVLPTLPEPEPGKQLLCSSI